MLGTVIGLLFMLIIFGVVWWAVVNKFYPLIQPYIGEPFATIIYVIMIILMVVIVLWAIAQVLGLAGIHVAVPGLGR